MNEAIATKALENLRARVAELETDRDAARAELARWEGHDAVTATLIRQAETERDELKAAARAAVLAGHYTARQQLIVDLTRLGVLSPDETRQAMQALDAAADGTEAAP